MPNAKRQRQKQGRSFQRQAALAAQRRQARRKRIVAVLLILAFVAVGAAGITSLVGNDDGEDVVSTDGQTTTTSAGNEPPPPCPPTSTAEGSRRVTSFPAAPSMCIDPAKSYTADIVTSQGKMTVALDAKSAPKTVNNFVFLSRYKFYDSVICHRVITGFVAQCGDPDGTGRGGPGYTIEDERPAGPYKIGSLAMANTGAPNSGGSQFFIITGDRGAALPSQYSLFGQVAEGLETVKALDAVGAPSDPGTPKTKVTIESVTIREA